MPCARCSRATVRPSSSARSATSHPPCDASTTRRGRPTAPASIGAAGPSRSWQLRCSLWPGSEASRPRRWWAGRCWLRSSISCSRRRFAPGVSVVVSVFCTVLPPVFHVGPVPEHRPPGPQPADRRAARRVAALGSPGYGWLPAWMVLVLVLSFTRDANVVLIAATGWLALRERSRRSIALLATGVLASLPAPLLFAAPFRDNLAYAFNAYRVPTDTSWNSILSEYPHPDRHGSQVRPRVPAGDRGPAPGLRHGRLGAHRAGQAVRALRSRRPLPHPCPGSQSRQPRHDPDRGQLLQRPTRLVLIPAIAAGLGMLAERAWPGRRPGHPAPRLRSGVVRPGGHPRPARRGGIWPMPVGVM